MYFDVGKSIKNVVSIVVKIGYALSIIGAFLIVIGGLLAGDFGALILSLIGAAISGGLGCLCTWLGGLWLYAYGEITDRLISIDEKMSNLENDKLPVQQEKAPENEKSAKITAVNELLEQNDI